MDVAYVSAMAALAGSIVGGLTSGGTTWLSQRAQARAGQMADEFEGVGGHRLQNLTRCKACAPVLLPPSVNGSLLRVGALRLRP